MEEESINLVEKKSELDAGLEHFDSEEEIDYSYGLFDNDNKKENFMEKQTPEPVEPVDFEKLLKEDYKGLLKRFDVNNFDMMARPMVVMLLPFFYKNEPYLKKWTDILYEVALAHKSVTYVLGDFSNVADIIKSKLYDRNYERYTSVDDVPRLYAIDEQQRKFQFEGFRTIEAIRVFSEDLLNGKLYLSESIPPLEPTEPLVKIAVGDNFEQLVMQSDKNVCITFYASWCCFGMELLPKMNEMAEMLKDDDIVFVKMDGELNYIPLEFKVGFYPQTIYMPKYDKIQYIEYNEGPRTIGNLMKFLVKSRNISNIENKQG